MALGDVPEPDTDQRALWDAALAALTARGARSSRSTLGSGTFTHESLVLSSSSSATLNAYLARAPRSTPITSLADLIAYNTAHEPRA